MQPEKAIGIIIYTEKLLQTSGKNSVSQQDGANRNESATKGGDSGGRGDPNASSREDPGDKLKPFVLQVCSHEGLDITADGDSDGDHAEGEEKKKGEGEEDRWKGFSKSQNDVSHAGLCEPCRVM